MGLFDFFIRKNIGPRVKDLVWMNHNAKLEGCFSLLSQYPNVQFIAWFSETEKEFRQYLESKTGTVPEIKLAKSYSNFSSGKSIIFLEHYPLKSKEESLMKNWTANEVIVLNSLDEPLFEVFGSERIIGMMKALGMQEKEMIEHTMVSKSISNAQRKLDKKVPVEQSANSSREWFKRNIHK